MKTWYVLPFGTDAVTPPDKNVERASALGFQLLIGDPSGKVTVYPSVVVMSEVNDIAIFPDDKEQVNFSEIQAAQLAATTAEQDAVIAKTNILEQTHQKLIALGLTNEEIAALANN